MCIVSPCVPGAVLDSFHVLSLRPQAVWAAGGGSRIPVTDEANEEHRFSVKAKVIGSECAAGIRPQF